MNRISNLISDWKWSIGLIHLGFLPLFIGAVFYYLERLSGCAAQDIFEVLNSGSYFFIHNRLVHVFSQWLPLLCFRLGLELKHVLIVFSASSVLHHYLLSMLCLFLLKDRNAAFGILLVQYFGITSSYYTNPHLEIQYCISLGIVFQSLLVSKELKNGFSWVLAFGVIFLMVNSYLPTAVFIPFAVLLHWKQVGVRNSLIYLGAILLSLGYKFTFLDPYVASVLDFQLVNNVPDSHIEGMYLFVLSFFDKWRAMESLIILVLLVSLVYQRRWAVIFIIVTFVLFYISLIVQFYGDGTNSEHVGLPITFFIVSTWVFLIAQTKKLRYLSLTVLVVFISFKSLFLGIVGSSFSLSTRALTELLSKTRCLSSGRVVIEEESHDLPFSNQALYQRSLLYSRVMGFENCVGIMVKDGVVNNLGDLRVHVPYNEELKSDDYSNDYFLNWLNSKAAEISIDSNVFPMKDDGFILVDETELCIVDN